MNQTLEQLARKTANQLYAIGFDDERFILAALNEATAALREQLDLKDSRAEAAEAERDRLHAFKTWTHDYLDKHGVPHHPEGTHGSEGCRIGDRMDWLIAELAEAENQIRLHEQGELTAIKEVQAQLSECQQLAAATADNTTKLVDKIAECQQERDRLSGLLERQTADLSNCGDKFRSLFERAQKSPVYWQELAELSERDNDSLTAELDSLRADRDDLDWLEKNWENFDPMGVHVPYPATIGPIRTAIRAARAQPEDKP